MRGKEYELQIICTNHVRSCGFRVDETYFRRHPQLALNVCGRDSAPLIFVEDYTNDEIPGKRMILHGDEAGRIVDA